MVPESEQSSRDASSRLRTSRDGVEALDKHLPDTDIDSRWWYWIAAVPAYFVVSFVGGAVLFASVFLGIFLDPSGLAVGVLFVPFLALAAVGGLVLSVMFPLAVYLDARAVAAADVEWDPDPVLYGLVALVGVVVTAFTVSVPLACYYLYRRHEAVGKP